MNEETKRQLNALVYIALFSLLTLCGAILFFLFTALLSSALPWRIGNPEPIALLVAGAAFAWTVSTPRPTIQRKRATVTLSFFSILVVLTAIVNQYSDYKRGLLRRELAIQQLITKTTSTKFDMYWFASPECGSTFVSVTRESNDTLLFVYEATLFYFIGMHGNFPANGLSDEENMKQSCADMMKTQWKDDCQAGRYKEYIDLGIKLHVKVERQDSNPLVDIRYDPSTCPTTT